MKLLLRAVQRRKILSAPVDPNCLTTVRDTGGPKGTRLQDISKEIEEQTDREAETSKPLK